MRAYVYGNRVFVRCFAFRFCSKFLSMSDILSFFDCLLHITVCYTWSLYASLYGFE